MTSERAREGEQQLPDELTPNLLDAIVDCCYWREVSGGDYSTIPWEVAAVATCCDEHAASAEPGITAALDAGVEAGLFSYHEVPCDCGCSRKVPVYTPTDSFREDMLRHLEPRPNRAERRRAKGRQPRPRRLRGQH